MYYLLINYSYNGDEKGFYNYFKLSLNRIRKMNTRKEN